MYRKIHFESYGSFCHCSNSNVSVRVVNEIYVYTHVYLLFCTIKYICTLNNNIKSFFET